MIDANKVHEAFMDCLFKDEEIEKAKKNNGSFDCACRIVNMIVGGAVVFCWPRLLEKKEIVKDWLNQLDDNFKQSVGGGYTFLSVCVDKNENHWGEHRNGDELVALGIGLGLCDYCIKNKLVWRYLPGGVPYIVIYDKPKEIDREKLPTLQKLLETKSNS